MNNMARFFPFLVWMKGLTRGVVRKDVLAGLVGALIVLPQGVAFATIAGLPPQYGLYAAIVPAIVAGLWGSSFHLVSGPTTAISLVVFASLSPLAEAGSDHYIALAITLSFLVGSIQLALGAFRLGTLVRLISPTVVVGFTAGAGVLIATSQLKNALGVAVPRGADFSETWGYVLTHLSSVHLFVAGLTALTLVIGLAVRRWMPKLPYMIPAIIFGSVVGFFLVNRFGAGSTAIATVGALPSILPPISVPLFDAESVRSLAMSALAITLLGLTEAVAIARAIGIRSGQRIDGNQEFIGQGLSNIAGSFFSSYPSSGSFNRSGLNLEAGAKTPLASIFAAGFLALALLFIGPLVAYIPLSVMAGVLLLVAWGIIDLDHMRGIIAHSRVEAGVLAITFFSTLFIGLEFAIFIGVLLSLTLFVRTVMFAEVQEVGKSLVHKTLRSVLYNKDVVRYPGTLIVRIEMSIVYMNCDTVLEAVLKCLSAREDAEDETIYRVVLNMSGVNFVDSAGVEMLINLEKMLTRRNMTLAFINVKHRTRDLFTEHHLFPRLTLYSNIDVLDTDLSRFSARRAEET